MKSNWHNVNREQHIKMSLLIIGEYKDYLELWDLGFLLETLQAWSLKDTAKEGMKKRFY